MFARIKFLGISVGLALLLGEGYGQVVNAQVASVPGTSSKNPQHLAPEVTVVTVSDEATPVSTSSAAVTLLPADLIQNSRAENVVDVLRQVPFLYLSENGGRGALATVTLRGAKPNLVLVMIDGIPVNDISNILGGSFDFSALSTVNIQQIEIVRGPLSSVYGSEAVAGVINIISQKHEDKPSVEISGNFGNFSTRQVRLSAVGNTGPLDYSVTGSYMAIGEQIGNDDSNLGTVAMTSSVRLGDGKFLQSTIRYHDKYAAGWPTGSGGPEFAIVRQAETEHAKELVGGFSYKQQWRPWWLYSLDLDGFLRLADTFTPAILDRNPPSSQSLPSSSSHTDFRRVRFAMLNNFRLRSQLLGHLQIGFKDEQGTNESLIAASIPAPFELQRPAFQANGELLYRSNRLTASFGMGIDRSEGFSTVLSPRVGANFLVLERTHLKASWGKGFKLPSFYALGQPIVGNPKLRPEYSNGFDLGIDHVFRKTGLAVAATYFHDSFRNLVDFSALEFRLVNRTQAETQGVEFETSIPVSGRIQVRAHLSFLQWRLQHVTEPLRDQPRWRGGASIDWRINSHLHTRLETLAVGRRFDFQVPVPDDQIVGGYSTTDVVLSYNFDNGLATYLRVDNLFNSEYHEFIGFPNPGIYARVGLTYRIGGRAKRAADPKISKSLASPTGAAPSLVDALPATR